MTETEQYELGMTLGYLPGSTLRREGLGLMALIGLKRVRLTDWRLNAALCDPAHGDAGKPKTL